MEFRPCIDIHNGKVKQIVGQSLLDAGNLAEENFVSGQDAAFYARMYQEAGITGGHIILLNARDSVYYKETKEQALLALHQYPGGLQVGGGITPESAGEFLQAGASHVIVTSYVFYEGKMDEAHLQNMVDAVGKEHLVLDLSCRRQGDDYYIVTDRWQKFTTETITTELLEKLSFYCEEFLVHAVDVEGKVSGIETELVRRLGNWKGIPITYAGGVSCMEDLEKLKKLGQNRLNVTIGSALDIFGGTMPLKQILQYIKERE